MNHEKNESTLSRWSRRKLETQQTAELAQDSVSSTQADGSPLAVSAEESDVEAPAVLTDADMPAIDSLTEDSDFSGFMSSGVSDELRNLALRKLFKAPVFNIRDGLDEYDEDYTYFEKLGDIVTCDMKHQIELEEQKLREAMDEEAEAIEEVEEISDDAEAASMDQEESSESVEQTATDQQPEVDTTPEKPQHDE